MSNAIVVVVVVVELDTTGLTGEEVCERLVEMARERRAAGGER